MLQGRSTSRQVPGSGVPLSVDAFCALSASSAAMGVREAMGRAAGRGDLQARETCARSDKPARLGHVAHGSCELRRARARAWSPTAPYTCVVMGGRGSSCRLTCHALEWGWSSGRVRAEHVSAQEPPPVRYSASARQLAAPQSPAGRAARSSWAAPICSAPPAGRVATRRCVTERPSRNVACARSTSG